MVILLLWAFWDVKDGQFLKYLGLRVSKCTNMDEIRSQRGWNHNIGSCEQNIKFISLNLHIDLVWVLKLLNFVWDVSDHSFLKLWATMVKNGPIMAISRLSVCDKSRYRILGAEYYTLKLHRDWVLVKLRLRCNIPLI